MTIYVHIFIYKCWKWSTYLLSRKAKNRSHYFHFCHWCTFHFFFLYSNDAFIQICFFFRLNSHTRLTSYILSDIIASHCLHKHIHIFLHGHEHMPNDNQHKNIHKKRKTDRNKYVYHHIRAVHSTLHGMKWLHTAKYRCSDEIQYTVHNIPLHFAKCIRSLSLSFYRALHKHLICHRYNACVWQKQNWIYSLCLALWEW